MPQYVDGFLLPIPKKKIAAYKVIAKKAAKIWLDHGALEYRECIGEDLAIKGMIPFTDSAKSKAGETVVFAWIVYKSRAQRDRVNAKVMSDPRMSKICDPKNMPFDCKRMAYGGFEVLVKG